MLGYRYGHDPATFVDPRSRPAPVGIRAPHVPLDRDGQQVSTLDFLGNGFTLFAGPAGKQWCTVAARVATDAGIRLDCQRLRDSDGECASAFGINHDGAILIRPDGFIAWRLPEMVSDAGSTLRGVLARLLCRA